MRERMFAAVEAMHGSDCDDILPVSTPQRVHNTRNRVALTQVMKGLNLRGLPGDGSVDVDNSVLCFLLIHQCTFLDRCTGFDVDEMPTLELLEPDWRRIQMKKQKPSAWSPTFFDTYVFL